MGKKAGAKKTPPAINTAFLLLKGAVARFFDNAIVNIESTKFGADGSSGELRLFVEGDAAALKARAADVLEVMRRVEALAQDVIAANNVVSVETCDVSELEEKYSKAVFNTKAPPRHLQQHLVARVTDFAVTLTTLAPLHVTSTGEVGAIRLLELGYSPTSIDGKEGGSVQLVFVVGDGDVAALAKAAAAAVVSAEEPTRTAVVTNEAKKSDKKQQQKQGSSTATTTTNTSSSSSSSSSVISVTNDLIECFWTELLAAAADDDERQRLGAVRARATPPLLSSLRSRVYSLKNAAYATGFHAAKQSNQ